MGESLVCWKCGASLGATPVPIGRRDECPTCHADLRVCRMCEFYDPSVSRSCREPIADEVHDKERANFCGYFKAAAGAWGGDHRAETEEAKSKLAALFGDEEAAKQSHGGEDPDEAPTEAEAAKQKLERLFGIDDKSKG